MKIGAHVSSAGGLDKAFDRAQEIGAETIQIFGSSPQSWMYKPLVPDSAAIFKSKMLLTGITPVFFHGIYLINLGSPNPSNLEKSISILIDYMVLADQIDAAGVIFHLGSHKGMGYHSVFNQTVGAISEILNASPLGPSLIIENSAGMGHHIGANFSEIGQIIRAVESPRIKVCLDTEHSFAAGYDVATPKGLESTLEDFEREIGLTHLVAVHANDAKVPFGSGVDRHENIGHGYIGTEGFKTIMGHPAFEKIPFILEVPGIDRKGPDSANIEILKGIRKNLELHD